MRKKSKRLGRTKDIPLSQWLLMEESKILPPGGHLATSQGTIFDYHKFGMNANGIQWVEDRDTAKRSAMPEQPLQQNK